MKKIFRFITSILPLMFLTVTGCSIFPESQPNIPTTYFDLGAPASFEGIQGLKGIEVQSVKSMDPYNERMVFRSRENNILIDDYNRWASLPSDMLKRYLIIASSQSSDTEDQISGKDKTNFRLVCTIISLEGNLETSEITVSLFFEIINNENASIVYSKTMTECAKIDKMTGENFAATAKTLVDKILVSLANNISKIKTSK